MCATRSCRRSIFIEFNGRQFSDDGDPTNDHREVTGGNKMKKTLMLAVATVVLILVAGCAPGPNQLADSPDDEGTVAGFWRGLWHGIIAPITFIISLFSNSVHVYEVHNNGGWYNFGFLLGLSIIFGGGGGGAGRRSARNWR